VSDIERRYTPVPVQVRADGDKQKIGGYAAMFGKASRNLGGFVEMIVPTFFNTSRTAGWPDVIARYNHDDNMLLGSTGGNTLRLLVDDTGLAYEVDPPKSRADIVELIARGDVRKSSFAFRLDLNGDEWTTTDQGFPLRKLVSGSLVDVAPVNIPAYPDTTAGLRSLAKHVQADVEEVRAMAEADELRRFFTRTDRPAPKKHVKKTFGPAAAAQLLARKQDPWA
jgi:hypothetical protein